MNRTEKTEAIAQMTEALGSAPHAFLIDFQGISVPDVTELPPFEDGQPRPVAVIVGDTGSPAAFVANELWLQTDDDEALADFLNATPQEVVFGQNMTSLTLHVGRALVRGWSAGDEVIVTELDHHANADTWRALGREHGIRTRTVPMEPASGELRWDALEAAFTRRTRLLAIGAASNALGTITDVAAATRLAHDAGALCFVDAVHFAAHALVDVQAIGCDFLVCSPYKFYGPHLGVLYGRRDLLERLDAPKLEPAPDHAPDRLETGTLSHEAIAGAGAAVDWLASLASGAASRREALAATFGALHERGLAQVTRLWEALRGVPGLTLYGPPPARPRTSTLSFAMATHASDAVARHCADRGVFVSNGDFYATTVVRRLGHAHAPRARSLRRPLDSLWQP